MQGSQIKKSFGVDKIPSKAYKLVNENISEIISKLINMSFDSGVFPECLKIGKINPIFKNGDKETPNNYRPITTLNTLSKIFEEAMKTRITSFLETNNLIIDAQFGFRKKHNTETAVIALTDNIYKNLNIGRNVGTIFIDLKKAFDTVNIKILLDKIQAIGIRGNAFKWLKSYLNDRQQFTIYNNSHSSYKTVSIGVPQGSRLSPILYLIYVNDIKKFTNDTYSIITLFADDTSLTITGDKPTDLKCKMNEQLKLLNKWFLANRLTLSIEKTPTYYSIKMKKKIMI